jgi:multiple sugar transport system substrate-binding protein
MIGEAMTLNRRQFLSGLAATAAGVGLAACGGKSGGGGGGGNAEEGDLKFAWWSNPVRTKNTNAAIEAYTKAHPKVKISAQPGEFATYWDKLATQVAGNTAPDLIQMDMAYIAEYGKRNALLDLAKYGADTSKFVAGSVDSGKIAGKLVGVNAGINSPTILANPKIFEKAKVAIPDDTTWTWDQLRDVAAEVAAKAGVFGYVLSNNEVLFQTYLRQNGKQLFTPDGLGFDAAAVGPYFDMTLAWSKAKAIPSPTQIGEEAAKSLDQQGLATGKAAMYYYWSNQVEAVSKAAGTEMKILRLPSLTGKATERKAWYKASMLWSASSRTKYPEATVALINWWVNSKECADLNLAERGVPANTEILSYITPKLTPAQANVAKFIADIKPELADTPIAPPPGGGKIAEVLFRYQTDVLFGRLSVGDAASKFVAEAKSNLRT